MKKKLLLPLFLLPFVVGCSSQTNTVEELLGVISKYEDISLTRYSVEAKGRAFGFDMSNESDVPKVYKKTERGMRRARSVLYGIPIRLNAEDFYLFDEFLDPQCQYYKLKGQIVDMEGSPTVFQSEILEDGGLKFWAINSNNKVKNFGHYYPQEGYDPADPYSRQYIDEFSGKIDGCYIYDKYGYLIYEEFKTHTQNGPDSLTANTSCTYTYYA